MHVCLAFIGMILTVSECHWGVSVAISNPSHVSDRCSVKVAGKKKCALQSSCLLLCPFAIKERSISTCGIFRVLVSSILIVIVVLITPTISFLCSSFYPNDSPYYPCQTQQDCKLLQEAVSRRWPGGDGSLCFDWWRISSARTAAGGVDHLGFRVSQSTGNAKQRRKTGMIGTRY